MEWLLLLVGMLSILGMALAIKVCLKLKKLESEPSSVSERSVLMPEATGENVIPFPQRQKSSRIEGISDELWERWVKISAMEHSKERADLLLELMNDTVRHANEEKHPSA